MRFTIDEIDPSLLGAGLPDAFQRFTAEFLRDEIPGLTAYPAAGKDGGIDLRADNGVQTVVECKVVGSEGLEHLLPRWRTTANALRRNLKDPAGPPRGQAQYLPWYDVIRPVRRYIVSTTGTFLNAAQEDEFRKELRQLFDDLSAFPHLAHLRDIAVEVRDWTHLWQHTPPWLRLRWFRRSRPTHFLPLDTRFSGAGFREYLDRARLPYYSRSEHLKRDPVPEGLEIHDENALLARLEDSDVHGMLISGSGGVGKTRLSLELAWRALEAGWAVLRASERITADALTELARELTPRDRTLVLFDYVETQPTFPDVVATLGDLNDSYGLHLRYLANCRTSYAGTFQVLHRFQHLDLSPPPGDGLRSWLQRYRGAAVERILSGCGLGAEAYRKACHEVPVLAVFLCWLADHGRQAEFAALLDEPDIGSWVLSSVRRSLPAPLPSRAGTGHPVDRDLALLMGMLPIPTGAFDALPPDRFAHLRDRLATDVWIERVAEWADAPERWATIHDVLADQVLLAFVRTIRYTVPEFVRELLRTAATANAVEPAFVALQRVFHHAEFEQVHWADTVRLEMERVPATWRPVRTSLLRSSILTEPERVHLLGCAPEVWAEATADPLYQLAVGSLCKWATKVAPDALNPAERATLARAALLAGEAADRSNFVLTYGLRLTPELRELARNWLWTHPAEFQTHYLLVAWLNGRHGLDDVRHVVDGWCRNFPLNSHLAYVARAWLTAGGEASLVEEPIRRWLAEHAVSFAAFHVCTDWLDAHGDLKVVEEPIRSWLAEHAVDPAARFVYRSWLDAQGDPALVEEPIRRWFAEHAVDLDAQSVYRSWLDVHGDPALVEEPIRRWLAEHAVDFEAQFVYRGWLDAHGDLALVEEPIRHWLAKHAVAFDAQFVYRGWLDAHGDLRLVEEPIRRWLAAHGVESDATYIYRSWLDAHGDLRLVEDPIRRWLATHGGESDASYVYSRWLDADGDLEFVEEPIRRWLAVHATDNDANYVLRRWLDAQGDLALIEEPIRRWLTEHATDHDASYVFRAWLEAHGDLALIEEPIQRWLTEHATNDVASYVFRSWLDAHGDPTLVKEPIGRWLAEHAADADASYVFRGWLNAHGDPMLVKEPIRRWLAEHAAEADATYVYQGWLDADGDLELIEEPLQRWFAENRNERNAAFVYESWLNAGGSLDIVREHVLNYLEAYPILDKAGSVYASWLNAGGKFTLVREGLLQWMKRHTSDPSARSVVTHVARCADLPPETVHDLLSWCIHFPIEDESLSVLTRLGIYFRTPEFAVDALVACETVLPTSCLALKFVPPRVRVPITAIFLQFIINPAIQQGSERTRVDRLFAEWLRHRCSFGEEMEAPRILQNGRYLQRVAELIRDGFLDERDDRSALTRFVAWVDRWSSAKKGRWTDVYSGLLTRTRASK